MSKRYTRAELMKRVQTSINELHLTSMTQADKKRLGYVEQGLFALDEEQSLLKAGIEELLEAFKRDRDPDRLSKPNPTVFVYEKVVSTLVEGLEKLVKEPLPRVSYPDRKLLEDWKTQHEEKVRPAIKELDQKTARSAAMARSIPVSGPAPSKRTVKQLARVQRDLHKIPKTKAKVK